MTPSGAAELARMRFAGKRPAGFIVVTEAKEVARRAVKGGFHPLVFDPSKDYDWRVVKSLDVAVVTRLKRDAVAQTCRAIFDADPHSFCVTYDDGKTFEHEAVIAAR